MTRQAFCHYPWSSKLKQIEVIFCSCVILLDLVFSFFFPTNWNSFSSKSATSFQHDPNFLLPKNRVAILYHRSRLEKTTDAFQQKLTAQNCQFRGLQGAPFVVHHFHKDLRGQDRRVVGQDLEIAAALLPGNSKTTTCRICLIIK